MSLIDEINALGADTKDALGRFMGNSELYEKMLKKYPKVVADSPVLEFSESGDIDAATSNAHALKGVTGNLSLTPLYKGYTEIVELFRGGETDKAIVILKETLEIQKKFLECISKYL